LVERVEYDDGIGPRTFGKSEPAAGISGRHDVEVRYVPRRPAHLGWETIAEGATPGIVFDPFSGTTTTGEVALKTGRSFIGVELYPQHVETGRRRCAEAMGFVRQHYGYAAVYDRILNPPTPEQDDDGGDSNVIHLSDARQLVRIAIARNGATVWSSSPQHPGHLFETKFMRRKGPATNS
jgi:DNA methylase